MKKKEEDQELVFGVRFDPPDPDKITMKDFESKPKPKTTRERFDDKFIRRKGGTLARRGTAGAQRAENRERNRERAKQMARDRKTKKAKTKQVKIA